MLTKIKKIILYRFYKYLFIFKKYLHHFKRYKILDFREKILISCDNLRELETRSKSCQKEPELINWLENNSNINGKIFWDIGSNIGAYSMVAAKLGYKVLSFEPAFQNYFKLQENIKLNKLDELIDAYCISFGEQNLIGDFNYLDTSFASSRGNYNSENYFNIEYMIKRGTIEQVRAQLKKTSVTKRTLVFSIDNFLTSFNLEDPHYLKIDVDGGEFEILRGASNLLTNSKNLSSILVEYDEKKHSIKELEEFLKLHKWKIYSKHNRHLKVNNLILYRL